MDIVNVFAAKLHLLAAMYWTGSVLFLAFVGIPVLHKVRPPSFQRALERRIWQLAHRSMWYALGITLLTAVVLLRQRGQLNAELLRPDNLSRSLGQKMALVGAMIVLSFLHDIWLGPSRRMRDPSMPTDRPGTLGTAIPFIVAAGAIVIAYLSTLLG